MLRLVAMMSVVWGIDAYAATGPRTPRYWFKAACGACVPCALCWCWWQPST